MKTNRIILIAVSSVLIAGIGYVTYKKIRKKEQKLFFTEPAQRKTVSQAINATGTLELKDDLMKIGGLVQGVIQKMYVEENQKVKKGDKLADIDDGKGDTEVRQTKAAFESAQSSARYMQCWYKRNALLHEQKHISDDDFEKITRDYQQAQADVANKKALYDAAKLTFDNKHIKATTDGLIIGKISREGETVSITSPATIIYTIAKNIKKMKARLEVDESVIGDLTLGTTAYLTFDTYPDQVFKGMVSDISNSPITEGNTTSYMATVLLDNQKLLFKPGMTVNALLTIAEKKNVIALPGQSFKISKAMIKQIATMLNYRVKEVETSTLSTETTQTMKTVWVVKDNTFIERIVAVGVNDNAFFEITSGVAEHDNVVIDTVEPDAMKEMFKRFFGGGL